MGTWRANRRLVVTPDGSRILDPDEPQTGRVLANEGHDVPEDVCRRYGLGPYGKGAIEGKQMTQHEDKAARGPEPVQGRRGGKRRAA